MSWVKFNNVHREAYARRGLPFMEQHGEPVTEFESLVRRSDAYHVWVSFGFVFVLTLSVRRGTLGAHETQNCTSFIKKEATSIKSIH